MIRTKALLNDKDIMPIDLIDELTNGNNISYEGRNALGYLGNIPVLFEWYGNRMVIVRVDWEWNSLLTSMVQNYLNEMQNQMPDISVDLDLNDVKNGCSLSFYWGKKDVI